MPVPLTNIWVIVDSHNCHKDFRLHEIMALLHRQKTCSDSRAEYVFIPPQPFCVFQDLGAFQLKSLSQKALELEHSRYPLRTTYNLSLLTGVGVLERDYLRRG